MHKHHEFLKTYFEELVSLLISFSHTMIKERRLDRQYTYLFSECSLLITKKQD